MEKIVNARIPDLSEIRLPRLTDPIKASTLTRHLINKHLQPEDMERYGLPMYDLQLAFSQELVLEQFQEELYRRIAKPDQEVRKLLQERDVCWSAERYKHFMIQTLRYGEYLGVLPKSLPIHESLVETAAPGCPTLVVPHTSRDEMYDNCFIKKD